MAFVKGTSGNPGGRERVPKEVRDAFKRHTLEALTVVLEIMRDKNGKKRDRLAAANSLLDRAIGKPTQPISGDEDAGAIVVEIRQFSEE